MQLRHLHELQASNDQRRERQQAAEQRLSGLQVRTGGKLSKGRGGVNMLCSTPSHRQTTASIHRSSEIMFLLCSPPRSSSQTPFRTPDRVRGDPAAQAGPPEAAPVAPGRGGPAGDPRQAARRRYSRGLRARGEAAASPGAPRGGCVGRSVLVP